MFEIVEDDGQTQEHGYTISLPSGELKIGNLSYMYIFYMSESLRGHVFK